MSHVAPQSRKNKSSVSFPSQRRSMTTIKSKKVFSSSSVSPSINMSTETAILVNQSVKQFQQRHKHLYTTSKRNFAFPPPGTRPPGPPVGMPLPPAGNRPPGLPGMPTPPPQFNRPGMPPPPSSAGFGRPGMPPTPSPAAFGRPGMPPPSPPPFGYPGMPPPPPFGRPGMPPPPPGRPGMPMPPPPGMPQQFRRPGMPPPPPGMPMPPPPPGMPGRPVPFSPPTMPGGRPPLPPSFGTVPPPPPPGGANFMSNFLTPPSSSPPSPPSPSNNNSHQSLQPEKTPSQLPPDSPQARDEKFQRILSSLSRGPRESEQLAQQHKDDQDSQLRSIVNSIVSALSRPTVSWQQIDEDLALIPDDFHANPRIFQDRHPKLYSHYKNLLERTEERKVELIKREHSARVHQIRKKQYEEDAKDAVIIKPMQTIAALALASRLSTKKIVELLAEIEDTPRTPLSLISAEQAELVLTTLGKKVLMSGFDTSIDSQAMVNVDEESLILGETKFATRAPVVTIVGHVDHGKTTLLDSLRKTSVAKFEAGRITQSIGGFNVQIPTDLHEFIPSVTFLDTPGHAIFKHMRSRGTNKGLADIAILLVASTDGVQPMTKESAALIKESGIPHIVAVTKVDVQGGNTQKVLRQLSSECDIQTTLVGGQIPYVEVSALKGIGLEELLEQVALLSTDRDILFKPRKEFNNTTIHEWNRAARNISKGQPLQLHVLSQDHQVLETLTQIEDMALGYAFVVESKQTYGGAHLDVIVRQGVLRVGDNIVCGGESGTIRSITDSDGQTINEASGEHSTPVRILGLTPKDITSLGDDLIVLPSRDLADAVASRREYEDMAGDMLQSIDYATANPLSKNAPDRFKPKYSRFSRSLQIRGNSRETAEIEAQELRTIYVSLKADVKGSLDAMISYVESLAESPHSSSVNIQIVKTALGPEITRDDIDMAHTRGDVKIFAFNSKLNSKISAYAGEHDVQVYSSDIIFDVFDEFRAMLSSKLPTTAEDHIVGTAIVQEVFPINLSKLQVKRLATEASLSISGDPVPIHSTIRVLGSRCTTGELIRMGHGLGELSQIYWRIKRTSGRDIEYIHQDLQCLSIRHFKEQVPKVIKGQECGIMLNNSADVLPGDVIECYRVRYIHEQFDDSIARGMGVEVPEWKKYQTM